MNPEELQELIGNPRTWCVTEFNRTKGDTKMLEKNKWVVKTNRKRPSMFHEKSYTISVNGAELHVLNFMLAGPTPEDHRFKYMDVTVRVPLDQVETCFEDAQEESA